MIKSLYESIKNKPVEEIEQIIETKKLSVQDEIKLYEMLINNSPNREQTLTLNELIESWKHNDYNEFVANGLE